jgi:hypothetical protein
VLTVVATGVAVAVAAGVGVGVFVPPWAETSSEGDRAKPNTTSASTSAIAPNFKTSFFIVPPVKVWSEHTCLFRQRMCNTLTFRLSHPHDKYHNNVILISNDNHLNFGLNL